MRRWILAVTAAIAIALPRRSLAQDFSTRNPVIQLAAYYLELSGGDEFGQLFHQVSRQSLEALARARAMPTGAERVGRLLDAEFTWLQARDVARLRLALQLGRSDLGRSIDFYKSEPGRHFAELKRRAARELLADSTPVDSLEARFLRRANSAEAFSADDLEALRQFFRTDVGRAASAADYRIWFEADIVLRARLAREHAALVGDSTRFDACAEARQSCEILRIAPDVEAELLPDSPKPTTPASMHETGKVVLDFEVNATGRVVPGSAKVVETSHALYADALLAALPEFRFKPARLMGHPVLQPFHLTYSFVADSAGAHTP